jgi:hypothetical protein
VVGRPDLAAHHYLSILRKMFSLESILELLQKHRQRATYGAVAAWLSIPQRSLMQDRSKNHLNSWIVSKGTGLPTGYPRSALHPDLTVNERVLDTEKDLREWMASLR